MWSSTVKAGECTATSNNSIAISSKQITGQTKVHAGKCMAAQEAMGASGILVKKSSLIVNVLRSSLKMMTSLGVT
jgi:hypothetical protein